MFVPREARSDEIEWNDCQRLSQEVCRAHFVGVVALVDTWVEKLLLQMVRVNQLPPEQAGIRPADNVLCLFDPDGRVTGRKEVRRCCKDICGKEEDENR